MSTTLIQRGCRDRESPEKFTPELEFLKLKSGLVAGGDQQDRALYEYVSSPTASITVIFIVLTIAVAENRHVVTMDIAGAYLNASMSSILVYMYFGQHQPATMICELVRSTRNTS